MTDVDPDNEATFHVCVIRSDHHETDIPKRAIFRELQRCHFCEDATFAVKLALEEALTNAVKHGNQCDCSKEVTVKYAVTPEKAVVIVRDEGPGFLPEEVPDPTAPERLPVPSGRGIMLMRAYMDEVAFRDQGREVYFMKRSR
jgi:serine/threonine-protein kinase RsbW